MTDKQIKETKNGFYCIEPCCEIKELKEKLLSKEQECEELKENLSDLKKDLKFQNDKISEIELDLQNANNTIENLDLMRVGEYNALVDDYNKLKQTLTEIKEIAENVQSFVGRIDIEDDVCEQMEQILQKISEVEDGHIN